MRRYRADVAGNQGFRRLLDDEPTVAIRVLTDPHGRVQPRVMAAHVALLRPRRRGRRVRTRGEPRQPVLRDRPARRGVPVLRRARLPRPRPRRRVHAARRAGRGPRSGIGGITRGCETLCLRVSCGAALTVTPRTAFDARHADPLACPIPCVPGGPGRGDPARRRPGGSVTAWRSRTAARQLTYARPRPAGRQFANGLLAARRHPRRPRGAADAELPGVPGRLLRDAARRARVFVPVNPLLPEPAAARADRRRRRGAHRDRRRRAEHLRGPADPATRRRRRRPPRPRAPRLHRRHHRGVEGRTAAAPQRRGQHAAVRLLEHRLGARHSTVTAGSCSTRSAATGEWPTRLGTGVTINLTPWFHAMGTIAGLNACDAHGHQRSPCTTGSTRPRTWPTPSGCGSPRSAVRPRCSPPCCTARTSTPATCRRYAGSRPAPHRCRWR